MMQLIFLLIFCFSQWAFSCPEAFVDSYGTRQRRVALRVQLSTPKQDLAEFSRREVQDLNSVEVLNLLFNKRAPLQTIGFLSGTQVNGLIARSRRLKDPDNSNIFYLLVRIHIHLISPRNIPRIPVAIVKKLLVHDVKRLSPQQISAFTAEQIYALTRHQISVFTAEQIYALTRHQIRVLNQEQIQAFTPQQIVFFKEHIQYFSAEQLKLFLPEQINAISPSQAESLESHQRRSLMRMVQ